MEAVAGVGLALTVVQTLCSLLQTKEVRAIFSKSQYNDLLKELENKMQFINGVLRDVDDKHHGLSNQDRAYVKQLKDAVYDVDEFLDEVTTIAQQCELNRDDDIREKIRLFFSRKNKFIVSSKGSKKAKLLKKKLDAIAKNYADFGLKDVAKPGPVMRLEQTCSTISQLEVIGRERDLEKVVGMLLDQGHNSSDLQVSYVSIVGMGGLGKTTLAQLVYNDKRVKEAFSQRIWVCVSDEFKVEDILSKILGLGEKRDLTLEKLKTKVQALLRRKRFLLVLDDVWNELHYEWSTLKPFLVSDVSRSKIMVTTRSKTVALSIGNESLMHKLQGLSEENSWSLFKSIAFQVKDGEKEIQDDDERFAIGKVILKKCANVPLSIRVIASLLHRAHISQWRSFRDIDLAKMRHGEDSGIMPTLMVSYYNLSAELKSCFSICSLFPKDYVIRRKLLISIWLALGFLVSTHDGESMEDVGERYFITLLNRCFLQDIVLDGIGEVLTCKMHDLMHDLAVEVAGKETSIITSANESHTSDKIRHLSITGLLKPYLSSIDSLRTYIKMYEYGIWEWSSEDVNAIISKGRCLRVLDLSSLSTATLPNEFDKLLRLRYLDLSSNVDLKKLPKSITKLLNLQILKLTNCRKLKKLPGDTSKLVNLRTLDVYGCKSLTHMPRGMNKLKNLHTLPLFVLGGIDSKQVQGSKLVDLQALTSLKGDLCIKIQNLCIIIHGFSVKNMPLATGSTLKLKDAYDLTFLCGSFYRDYMETLSLLSSRMSSRAYDDNIDQSESTAYDDNIDQSEVHETLVEELCPNDDVTRIKMVGYKGKIMPSWASMIVSVKLSNVKGLQHVTSLSQLCHLKVLVLERLPNVEYIESHEAWALVSTPNINSNAVFFPVLEKLVLRWMPKLKGWWSEVRWEEMGGVGTTTGGCMVDATGDKVHAAALPFFPRLHELHIMFCRIMMYFPPCPHMKRLQLKFVNEALTFCMTGGIVPSAVMKCATSTSTGTSASASSSTSGSGSLDVSLCLEKLGIENEGTMNSVFKEFVGGAVDITLEFHSFFDIMGRTGIAMDAIKRCAPSVQHLTIEHCWKLRGIEHLSNLQSLEINVCEQDEFGEENEEEGKPWKKLQSLSSLKLHCCKEMVKLPKGLSYLGTSLQSLSIEWCNNMEELGECIGFLTSLQSLHIRWCPKLKALPESLKFLTSLQLLHIQWCHQLKSLPDAIRYLTSLTTLHIVDPSDEFRERCREPDGEDWSKICHIPNFNEEIRVSQAELRNQHNGNNLRNKEFPNFNIW